MLRLFYTWCPSLCNVYNTFMTQIKQSSASPRALSTYISHVCMTFAFLKYKTIVWTLISNLLVIVYLSHYHHVLSSSHQTFLFSTFVTVWFSLFITGSHHVPSSSVQIVATNPLLFPLQISWYLDPMTILSSYTLTLISNSLIYLPPFSEIQGWAVGGPST